jgi:4-aminobutyrate aminotransferase-like enzyme
MAGWRFALNPVEVPKVETKYRRIATPLPVPESLEILKTLDHCETTAMHGQMPVVWDRAESFQVHDAWGNTWIDFTSTIFVTNAGHANPRIVKALRDQLDKPLLHTYTYATQVRADYLHYLIEVTPPQFKKAFLLSAGTEATECALKLMRMYSWKTGKKRPGIVCFEGNWHGRTLGAQMMGYNPAQKEWIGYDDPNIYHLPFPYPWREEAISNPRGYFWTGMKELIEQHKLDPKTDLCGFMLETFQGWGAVFYPPEFVQELMAFAREHEMLVAFDEMQAGFGRTGKLFGYMHYGVEPDLLCCGKGAASGVSLSIVLGSQEVMDLPEIGSMSSTHSANPLVCAAGLANLQALLEDGLIENSRVLGKLFHARLNTMKDRFPRHIRYVLGKGLVAAIHFIDPEGKPLVDLCNRICEEAMRRGLLVVHTGRESIKLAPPFCITEEAILEGLDVLAESIEEVVGSGEM